MKGPVARMVTQTSSLQESIPTCVGEALENHTQWTLLSLLQADMHSLGHGRVHGGDLQQQSRAAGGIVPSPGHSDAREN
jgi:hypothetical protein